MAAIAQATSTSRCASHTVGAPVFAQGICSRSLAKRALATSVVERAVEEEDDGDMSWIWIYSFAGCMAGALWMYFEYTWTHGAEIQSTAAAVIPPDINEVPGAAAPRPAPLPYFRLKDQYGRAVTLDDILGDFSVIAFADTADPPAARERIKRLERILARTDEQSNMDTTRAVLFIYDNPQHLDGLPEVLQAVPKESPAKRPHRWYGAYGPDYDAVKDAAVTFSTRAKVRLHGKWKIYPEEGAIYFANPRAELIALFDPRVSPEIVSDKLTQWVAYYRFKHPEWHAPKAVRVRTAA